MRMIRRVCGAPAKAAKQFDIFPARGLLARNDEVVRTPPALLECLLIILHKLDFPILPRKEILEQPVQFRAGMHNQGVMRLGGVVADGE